MDSETTMRRREFAETDQREIDSFLSEMSYGVLGFQEKPREKPREEPAESPGEELREDRRVDLTPMNFVHERTPSGELLVYFHASRGGHRRRSLTRNPAVVFSVARELALIPSHFVDPAMACHAGAFFKSVLVYGTMEDVEDLSEKGRILTLLMQKLQPEGGYAPIDHTGGLHAERYAREMKTVLVQVLRAQRVSAKFKLGQNQSEEGRQGIREGLQRRGRADDLVAVREMEKRCGGRTGTA